MEATKIPAFIKPNLTKELFRHQRRDYIDKPLYLQVLKPNNKRDRALAPHSWKEFINNAAKLNKMSALLSETDGGYIVLSDATLTSLKEASQSLIAYPGIGASEEQLESYSKALARIGSATTTLQNDAKERRKRSEQSGWFLSNVIRPSLHDQAISAITEAWKTEKDEDHYHHMKQLIDYVATFGKDYPQINEELDELFVEIKMATTHSELETVFTQLEAIKSMGEAYLTQVVDGIRQSLDESYPAKKGDFLLSKLIIKVAEHGPVASLRLLISRGITRGHSFQRVLKTVRDVMRDYKPPEQTTAPVTRIHSASAYDAQPAAARIHPASAYEAPPATEYSAELHPASAYKAPTTAQYSASYDPSDDTDFAVSYEDRFHQQQTNEPTQLRGFLGRRVHDQDHQAPANQRVRYDQYGPSTQLCLHYQRGDCRFGDKCTMSHGQDEVNVRMTATEHQQWQLQQMSTHNRAQAAAQHHQQGTYPSMQPTGAYLSRPPQPRGPAPQQSMLPGRGYPGRGFFPQK